MTKAEKEVIRDRIWFLEHEARTMRDEAKRLRALIRRKPLPSSTIPIED